MIGLLPQETMDLVALVISGFALFISGAAFFWARVQERRAERSDLVRAFQGEKEAVAYVAYRMESGAWDSKIRRKKQFREELIAALCLAFTMQRADRTKALVYAALNRFQGLGGGTYRGEIENVLLDIYERMTTYQVGFKPEKFDRRVGALETLMSQLGMCAGATIEVSSPAFRPGDTIPKRYTGEDENLSPPLQWKGLPQGTKEIAIICDDPDALTPLPFVHWVLYKIPADRTGLPEGDVDGAVEGMNDFGRRGYDGCMPPYDAGVHHYHFKICALDTELEAPGGLSKDELLAAIEGHILDEGALVGTCERR